MAFYHSVTDPKKEKRRNSFGEEEGSRYRRNDKHGGNQTRRNDGPETVPGRKPAPGKGRTDGKIRKTDDLRFRSQERNDERRSIPVKRTERPLRAETTSGYKDYEYRTVLPESTGPISCEEQAQYILTGRNPIREALKNHRDLEKLLVQKGELSGSAMEIVQKAKEQKVMVQVVDKSRLDEIAPQHQGLIAFASAYQYATVDEIIESAKEKGEAPFIIILDGVTDPHNLGAIIRTAECAGAHGVIVPQHRSVGLTPAAVKASAGAVEYVKVARVVNLNRTIEQLQKENIWVYALTMEGKDYSNMTFEGGTALVVGAEGEGISRLTAEKCDVMVSLPMKGKLNSLNASVAAGIMMYHVMMTRDAMRKNG